MTSSCSEQDWWKNMPCPLHPSWKLGDISELDLRKLKHTVDTDENELMVVELAIYRAFLEFPRGTFYNQGRVNPSEALSYLEKAEERVSEKFQEDSNAVIGYGIIINTFRMWIRVDGLTESVLRNHLRRKDKHPNHISYIHIVQAYILSRLGPRWRSMALSLYDSALNAFPENCEWLFGKALMIGREARQLGFEKSWKNKSVRDECQKEKEILKRVLNIDPNFHQARAFYGQVLFMLGENGASAEISRALRNNPENRRIAMIAVRFYRRNNMFSWAEMILSRLLDTCNTAETNFQMGILYSSKARELPIPERFPLWKEALKYFNKGIELDMCHFPCFSRRAEMNALLGQRQKAHDLFEELFQHIYKNKPHLLKQEMHTIAIALEMPLPSHMQVFTVKELIELSHRYIILATEEGMATVDDITDNILVKGKIDKYMEKLKNIIANRHEKNSVRELATLKLSDSYLRLGQFGKAQELYLKMYLQCGLDNHKKDILWGLAKCYCNQKFYDKAIDMARELERLGQNRFNVHELYADVHLGKAKAKFRPGLRVDDMRCQLDIAQHFEQAIEMGSLEACYLFLNKVSNLHQQYFSLELRVPEILAKIRLVCENITRNVHTSFEMTLIDGSNIIHNETAKRNEIMQHVNKLFKFDTFIESACSTEIKKEYKQLELLRQARLEFEFNILKRTEGENWNDACKGKLTEILQIARVILDHVVHIYQTLVLKKPPGRTLFPITFDWDNAKVDAEVTKEKLKKSIDIMFPGYSMPESTFQIILEVQPMYDRNNLWLAALGSFTSALKHKTYVGEETFDLELKKAEWITFQSEDIVRQSCPEVEKLVLYFLSLFNTIKLDNDPDEAKSQRQGETDGEDNERENNEEEDVGGTRKAKEKEKNNAEERGEKESEGRDKDGEKSEINMHEKGNGQKQGKNKKVAKRKGKCYREKGRQETEKKGM